MSSPQHQQPAHGGATPSRIRAQMPSGWVTGEAPRPEVEFFTFPQVEGEGLFVPNMVGVLNPFAGELHEFAALTQGNLFAQFEDLQVLDVTWWERDAGLARAIITSRSENGRVLIGIEYLFIEAGWAVQLTATLTPPAYRALRPVFDGIAASAAVADHAGQGTGGAGMDQAIRLDEVASAAVGQPCERLDSVRSMGVYRSEGPVLSTDALELLVNLAQGSRPGRLTETTPAMAELQEAELMTGNQSTEEAGLILELLANPAAQITVQAHRGGTATDFQAWFNGSYAVIAAGPPAGYLDHEEVAHVGQSGYRQLDLITTEQLAAGLFAWAGAGPAWVLVPETETVSQEQLMSHWDAVATAPSAGAVDTAVWAEPWFIWTLNAVGTDSRLDEVVRISAGDRGTYRLYQADEAGAGSVRLEPEPSQVIFEHLLGTIAELVGPQ
ncbi:hypothetical protein [Citricoccus nitrophenolicus]|uniref:hypothetical protein n=1 Tax=Citricoccus nitrophenolicus TaxID=863575 RepID=UPI0031EA0A09